MHVGMKQPVRAQYGRNNSEGGLGCRELWMGSRMSHAYVHNRIKPNEGRSYLSRALSHSCCCQFLGLLRSQTDFLKQQRKVTFPVRAADKVTLFVRGGQWDVFRSCFSFFCQTYSVLLVTYLPPSRSCVMRDNIRKVDQCFLTIICIQLAFFSTF